MPIPLPEEIAQKIILLCYFYVALFPHFKLKIHKILYPHTVSYTIYGGAYLRFVSFLCYTRQGYVLHFHPNHHFSFPNYLFYLEIDLETVFEKPINHATFRPKNPSQKSPRNCRFYHFRHRNPAPLQHFSSIVPFSIQYRIPTLFLL